MRNRRARSSGQLRAEVRRLRTRLAIFEGTAGPSSASPAPTTDSAQILDQYPDAIIVLDTTWQIRFWNHAAEQLYGWSRDEVLSRAVGAVGEVLPVTGVLSGADRSAAQAALQSDGLWGGEVVQRHRDGHELIVHMHIQRVVEVANVTPAYLAFHHEANAHTRLAVTTQQVAAALQEAEARLRTVTESARVGLAIVDASHRYRATNQWYQEFLGLPAEALVGRNLADAPDLLAEQLLLQLLERVFRGEHLSAELAVPASPGHAQRRYGVRVAPGMEESEPVAVVVLIDRSEHTQAEEALRHATTRLRVLQRITQAFLADPSPNQEAAIIVEQLGRLLPSAQVFVLVDQADSPQAFVLAASVALPTPFPQEALEALAAGQRAFAPLSRQTWRVADVWAVPELAPHIAALAQIDMRALLYAPLRYQETQIGALVVSSATPDAFTEDHAALTAEIADLLALGLQGAWQERALELERRVAERTAALQLANVELARAARLKDEFLANMSHELRTPLHTILGRAEMLSEQVYGALSTEQDAAIRGIEESGRHLLALISDILDLAKIEAGTLELELTGIEVTSLCRQCLRMVAQPALLKQVALELTIDPAVTTIEVDARRLKQILVNLLVNAVKFTPSSGQVGLAVQGDPMRQALSFTVWDTGIGIAPDDQRRLFQPFVQLDPALSRQHGGAGLGLALVLRLVRLHQGSVTLESSPEAGSRFRVTLPWLQPSAEQSASAPGAALLAGQLVRPASTGAPPRILVAEDHEANSALLRDALTAAGYTVAVVRSGVEVLPRAEEFAPALILLDIQLPGIDGLTAIRQLRADPALASIPIIALTALAMPGDRERCLATGASAYLAKPVSLRILAATMAELLAAPDSETK